MRHSKLVKPTNRILASWKIATLTLAVLMTLISTGSVRSEINSMPGKCDKVIAPRGSTGMFCSSYTEIPSDIVNSGIVWDLHMEKGNHIDIVKNGSLIRSRLISLQFLNLENCKIRVVEPGAFYGANMLLYIYLSNNLITVLNPDIFASVIRLRQLYISSNPINIIEHGKSFPNSKGLQILDLSNCRLDTIPANIFGDLDRMKRLDLSGNKLKGLDWRLLQKTKNIISLGLEGNPWHCDCHVKFLMETLKNMGLAKVFENLKCTSAPILKWVGHLWNQVPEEDMTCLPQIGKRKAVLEIWNILFGILLVVSILIFSIVVWLRRRHREKRGIIQEPNIVLKEFEIKPTNADLVSMLNENNADTSLI